MYATPTGHCSLPTCRGVDVRCSNLSGLWAALPNQLHLRTLRSPMPSPYNLSGAGSGLKYNEVYTLGIQHHANRVWICVVVRQQFIQLSTIHFYAVSVACCKCRSSTTIMNHNVALHVCFCEQKIFPIYDSEKYRPIQNLLVSFVLYLFVLNAIEVTMAVAIPSAVNSSQAGLL